MSKTFSEGASFFTDDENVPPHLRRTFYSFMIPNENRNLYLDTLNLDHKVRVRVFLDQHLSVWLILVNASFVRVRYSNTMGFSLNYNIYYCGVVI
ncbi:hypothetical protein MHBO_003588 [Bonamia ostreae]|uniref:Uncharacterized protein n=1 Tax=Bonamia ostreae TaxID=126728 RepID=A0ABV2AQY7_9EUKA